MAAPEPVLLDWSDRKKHWGGTDRPCRYCRRGTPLLDEQRKPAHKVCAEKALTVQAADTKAAYRKGAAA